MKILFICFGYESIGVEYLISSLNKAGHKTDLIYNHSLFNSFTMKNTFLQRLLNEEKYTEERIKNINPDMICFSTVTENYRLTLLQAKAVKNFIDAPIVFGGVHTTSVPEKVIAHDYIDYLCLGEGEQALLELVEALSKKAPTDNIPNIWCKKNNRIIKNDPRPLLTDLNELPLPDKELFYRENPYFADVYGIMAKRGCLYRCSYCHNSLATDKQRIRQRSPENVIAELKIAKEKYKIKKICFYDDMLLSDKKWLQQFTELYIQEINLPFVCAVHPTEITKETVSLLSQAGCSAVGMGIQTTNEEIRKNMLNRFEKNTSVINALSLLRKTKILVYVDILIGIPSQDDTDLLKTAIFLNKHKPDMVLPIWLKYYPKLKITEEALNMKILSQKNIEDISDGIIDNHFAGISFSKEKAKLIYLLLLSPLLSENLFSIISKKKIYRLFPPFSSFIFIRIFMSLASLKSRLLKNKNKYIFSLKNSIMYLLFLLKRKMILYRKTK